MNEQKFDELDEQKFEKFAPKVFLILSKPLKIFKK